MRGIKMRRRAGAFSIIELVMILLVVAILAAVAITQVPDMLGMRISQGALKIQSDIRFAQRLAMQLQRRTGVLFSVASDTYSIYIENTYLANDWNINVKAQDPLTHKNFDVQLNAGDFQGVDITTVLFNAAGYALVFDRNGDPYGMQPSFPFTAAALTYPAGIVLNTNRKYILVSPATGRVNVQNTFP